MLRIILLLAAWLISTASVYAADARVQLLVEIDNAGLVTVTQRWSGLSGSERLSYDTRTQELGVLEGPVSDGEAVLEYASAELLRRDGDRYRLIIAKLEHAGQWLDFDVTLRYPDNLEYVSADPEPSFTSSVAHGLMWSLSDQRELILMAVFGKPGTISQDEAGKGGSKRQDDTESSSVNRSSPPQPATSQTGPGNNEQPSQTPASDEDAQVESAAVSAESDAGSAAQPEGTSTRQQAGGEAKLLLDGDPLLLEFRLLIGAAAREGKADEDFLQALEKLLLKFYYLLDAMGATDEYEPRD